MIKPADAQAGEPGRGAEVPRGLTPDEFASELAGARDVLWFVAAAVLGHRSDAEDVVQEATATALAKLGEFTPGTRFAAWMSEIVRNVARNYVHKRARRKTRTAGTDELDRGAARGEGDAGSPLTDRGDLAAGQASFDDRVVHALAELPEQARICLLLRTLRSMPYREIAMVLGIPEGTAMSHVHRARHAMKERLLGDSTG